jgi:hypothetical protein
MRIPRPRAAAALALAAIVLSGCPARVNRGYTYKPIDARGQPVDKWSQTIDGVSLEGGPYKTLVDARVSEFGFDLINHSVDDVTVLGAELLTNGRTIKAGVEKWMQSTFVPGAFGDVLFEFEYYQNGGDADAVLGRTITWTWRIQIGDRTQAFDVRMVRVAE